MERGEFGQAEYGSFNGALIEHLPEPLKEMVQGAAIVVKGTGFRLGIDEDSSLWKFGHAEVAIAVIGSDGDLQYLHSFHRYGGRIFRVSLAGSGDPRDINRVGRMFGLEEAIHRLPSPPGTFAHISYYGLTVTTI
ncbi:MAG: hypothetical protein HY431_02890 [Candidatus Levybacteria bacterium]|nr:hypothetical protein [Candidatus Levybacteria bacterium]